METRYSELVNDSQIKVDFQIENVTDESGTRQRSIVRRGRAREIWTEGKVIGRGAYGTVSIFIHQKPNGRVKIQAVKKVMKEPLSAGGVDFRKELDAILKFSLGKYTDFFVKCHGWYSNHDCVFIVMEYLEHGDLDAYMKQLGRPLSEPEVVQIVSQLAEALDLLHRSKFVHRDIKPANIFIVQKRPEWQVKIGDFGISKRIKLDSSLRSTVGTRLFCAPEIQDIFPPNTSDESRYNYTEKVDIWSVGATAFFLLFYIYPFPRITSLERYVDEEMELQFPSTPKASQHCYDFLRVAMAPSAARRLSVGDVLEHAWLKDISIESIKKALPMETQNDSSAYQNQAGSLTISSEISQINRRIDEAMLETIEFFAEEKSRDREESKSRRKHMNDSEKLRSVEKSETSTKNVDESHSGWYIKAIRAGSVTTKQLFSLSETWKSRGQAEDFIKNGGVVALVNLLNKINTVNFWTLPTFITAFAIPKDSVELGKRAAVCLFTLTRYPEGVNEALRNQKIITSLIHALVAWDIFTRERATAALTRLMLNQVNDKPLEQNQEAHAVITRKLAEIQPHSKTRWYNIWVSNVSLTLDDLLERSIYPVEEKKMALGYLDSTLLMMNQLVKGANYSSKLREDIVEALQKAGVNNPRVLFFDRLHKLGSPKIDKQIEDAVINGLVHRHEIQWSSE